MKKFKAKIYLKNKKELNEYLKNLVKIKKNPTLEDVKFSFKWEQSLVTNNYHVIPRLSNCLFNWSSCFFMPENVTFPLQWGQIVS